MVDYIRNPANTKLPILYQKLTKTPLRSGGVINAGSLLKIG